jgi:hypothetical protein
VSRRTVDRWAQQGIPFDDADGVAVELGFHPIEVWGKRWEAE